MTTSILAKRGFSLIEVLFVITILVIIAGFSIEGFRNYARYQEYEQAVSDVTFILNQTRLSARSAVADSSYGIKFSPNGLTQFAGDTYVATDPKNVTTAYTYATLDYDLTGGTDELVFDKLTGLPTATGTVTVEGVHFPASTTIEVTSAGVVQ